ncbi:hypothetical protein QGP82_23615 [Leptothoe sp. LEGE 181152]|uniref:Uncharacterized protein n=1 Tax=Adonisia turfae CCMR0081 TaxID=2292702 RepID=A0A6M0RWB2_9CYAN|nr:hypothetical protein [Adonisia turfae]MDV3351711.1 hypothetical protein [Leptothoe sp. LEGE 181152]NEZ60150.1 hypothetical protein [Adonisia turfae CCMR0081]
MQQQFLKLSDNRVIGLTGNIAELHHMTEQEGGSDSYWITCIAGEPYELKADEFQKLMAWATHPDRCMFLEPDELTEGFQEYKARGGFMQFDQWKQIYQRHQRLVKELGVTDNPSKNLIDTVGQLEGSLLL